VILALSFRAVVRGPLIAAHRGMSSDRRRTLRVHCDLPVEWRRSGRTVTGRARDLNGDGLFIETDDEIELDHIVDLVVMLPTGPVSFIAVARYARTSRHGRGIGVSIHVMSNEDRARWSAYYRHALRRVLETVPIVRHCVRSFE